MLDVLGAEQTYKILIVDDEPTNLIALASILESLYTVIATTKSTEVISILRNQKPDLILLDVMMPDLDGYDLLKQIKAIDTLKDIPTIFITSLEDSGDEEKGLKLGAVDYISKPINKAIVLARIKNHLELKHAQDLLRDKNRWLEVEIEHRVHENTILQEASLTTLVGLAETRDSDTGNHIIRTRYYCEVILKHISSQSRQLNKITNSEINLISKAAQLHDIGKIGIPDSILMKPGGLTSEEFEIMKNHCLIGSNAIDNSIHSSILTIDGNISEFHPESLAFLEMAKVISEYHHEKWDGTGYPKGLDKEHIPYAARVMAIADVFDALTSKRVYKESIPFSEAFEIINSKNNTHFDPQLIIAFNDAKEAVYEIYKTYS
ncbi:MAG: response regulator [Spirochaetaceae bacterium]